MNIKDEKLRDILESDDELPSDYDETPYVPAYKNDDRFKKVKFNWRNIIKRNEELQSLQETSNKKVAEAEQSDKALKKGILNKSDIFISKCIETADDTTLLCTTDAGRAIENGGKQRYKIVVKM